MMNLVKIMFSFKAIFCYFLVYNTDPLTQIFAFKKKINKLFLTFFIFSDVKKLPDLKKKIKY